MKRMLALVLALALMLSAVPTVAAAQMFQKTKTWNTNQFSDVTTDWWYYESVQNAYELGLMNGMPDGKFQPDGKVTLAETVTVAARIHARGTTGAESFVQGSPWYQVYVDYALQNGILAAELADYTRAATRLEFAQILAKTLPASDLFSINHVEDGAIPDVADDESVYLLYRAGILTGNDDKGTFAPDSDIDRSEVAAIVTRMALPELRKSVKLVKETSEEEDAVTSRPSDRPSADQKDEEDPTESENEQQKPEQDSSVVVSGETTTPEEHAVNTPFDQAYPDLFASGEYEYSGEHIMIKLAGTPSGALSSKLRNAGIVHLEKMFGTEDAVWYTAYVEDDVETTMAAVRAIKDVLVAEYDFAYSVETVVDGEESYLGNIVHHRKPHEKVKKNPHVDKQWHLGCGGIHDVWEKQDDDGTGVSQHRVVVAVIDTGVDYDHEDLSENIWINVNEIPDNGVDDDKNGYVDDYYGVNIVAGKGNGDDDNGHGTHVAGIIAAMNNNVGVVGIAYNAQIMSVKAGMASGYFLQSDVAKAVYYAYEHGADIINMSFGGNASSIAVQDALETAYNRCVLVAAAGNDGKPNEKTEKYEASPMYPAAFPYVIGVMSVGPDGVESNFSNYDVNLYNTVEYEVYAPGEDIMSTIPGNQYAAWDGTSMAAPIISGMAALLREQWPDTEAYPNKFIMGQIVGSTKGNTVACVNPDAHGAHNRPGYVDVNAALTKLPTPDVNVFEWFAEDRAELSGENIDDGVIDAGETLALAFSLRNRWGKSTDTIVTVDAITREGVEGMVDPYVTIREASKNYGEIGTYSHTNVMDALQDEDKYFIVKIDKDCPNDYIITLNVTVSCKNALDETDTTNYVSKSTVQLKVRRGVVLDGSISRDTTLDPSKYYIVSNGLKVEEGATLTVKAGTQIQFWAAEATDPLASSGIAVIDVEGKLICSGTPDNPVKIFPSDLMSSYRVDIHVSGKGEAYLYHTDVVNPYLNVDYIEGGEFTQNYQNASLKYRTTSGYTSTCVATVGGQKVGSVFYKLGCSGSQLHNARDCIFVDCRFTTSISNIQNNVFYGNNNYLGQSSGGTIQASAYTSDASEAITKVHKIVVNEKTGTTYLQLGNELTNSSSQYTENKALQRFAEVLGGTLVCINDKEELQFLKNNGLKGVIGLLYDVETDGHVWVDGTKLDPDIKSGVTVNYSSGWGELEGTGTFVLIELPAQYVESIQLEQDKVVVDNQTGYQIKATTEPMDLFTEQLIYQSLNEDIVTVDKNGLVTPVKDAFGTATVRVYAPDYYLWEDLTVQVIAKTELEAIELGEDLKLAVGDSYQLLPVLIPEDTSERTLQYESSNERVATVNEEGKIVARREGETEITVTSAYSDATDTLSVRVVIPVESVKAEEQIVMLQVDKTDYTTDDLGISMYPEAASETETILVWDSSNPEVVTVNEDGTLTLGELGSATVRATALGTEQYAEVVVCVSENTPEATVVQLEGGYRNYIALLDDGTLWYWGGEITVPTKMPFDSEELGIGKIVQFAYNFYDNYVERHIMILDDEGALYIYRYKLGDMSATLEESFNNGKPMSNVAEIRLGRTGSSNNCYCALRNDGSAWVWNDTWDIAQVSIANVVDIAAEHISLYFLDQNGDVWELYDRDTTVSQVASGIIVIHDGEVFETETTIDNHEKLGVWNAALASTSYSYEGTHAYIDEDGTVYISGGSNDHGQNGVGIVDRYEGYKQVLKVENAKEVFLKDDNSFFQTQNGEFYSVGYNTGYINQSNYLGNLTEEKATSVPRRVYFGMSVEAAPVVAQVNLLEENGAYVLTDKRLCLDYNVALMSGAQYGDIVVRDSDGYAVALVNEIYLDKLYIEALSGWKDGETYTLTIPASAVKNKFAIECEQVDYTFTYEAPSDNPGPELIVSAPFHGSGTAYDPYQVETAAQLDKIREYPTRHFIQTADIDMENYGKTWEPVGTEEIPFSGSYSGNGFAIRNLAIGYDAEACAMGMFGLNRGVLHNICLEDLDCAQHGAFLTSVSYVGGIAAVNEGSIIGCSVSGDIDFEGGHSAYGGGIAGSNYGTISKCVNHASVYVTAAAHEGNAGGIACVNRGAIRNCYNTGEIAVSAGTVVNGVTEAYAGGIAGVVRDDGTVENCYNIANVTFDWDFAAEAPYLDGIVSAVDYEDSVSNCYYLEGVTDSDYGVCLSSEEMQDAESFDGFDFGTVWRYLEESDYQYPVLCALYGVVIDEEEPVERDTLTGEEILDAWNEFQENGYATSFWHNAILNRLNETSTSRWMKITAPSGSGTIALGGNYWGTTDLEKIELQLVDVADNVDLYNLAPGTFLTEAPEDLWPFVTNAGIMDKNGDVVTTVGGGKVTFFVEFNRNMDMTMDLQVRFGSYYPYGDYEVKGDWIHARRWEGEMTLNTFIESGVQYLSISNGKAADSYQKLYEDWGRFQFTLDTTQALTMSMQATATNEGVLLTWFQDDYEMLAGYNIYRSTSEDGLYTRINPAIIPVGTNTYLDTEVEPSKTYFYSFTVVTTGGQATDNKNDVPESKPSGKAWATAKDTLPPKVTHAPVTSAFAGNNTTISALVSDELEVQKVTLYFRAVGETEWTKQEMMKSNSKYLAIIQGNLVTTAGLEYYIEAYDGSNYTYKGTEEAPYSVTVYAPLDTNALGDVDGDKQITILDALMILQAKNDQLILTEDQFKRADLNQSGELDAVEVLTILRYVNGEIGSVVL